MNEMKKNLVKATLDLVKNGKKIIDTNDYQVFEKENGDRYLHGKNFNMYFRKSDGFTAKWGNSFDDDPPFNPHGNEIADIEITKACRGIRTLDGKRTPCTFCFPSGTLITMSDGNKKPIEEIGVCDKNLSMHFSAKGNSFCEGEVKKVFERDYNGDLIVIELEDGKIIKATPEHPFLLRDGTEILAKDLTGNEDLVVEEEYTHCWFCGKPKLYKQFYNRYYCSKKCFEQHKKPCLICGNKTENKRSVFCKNCIPTSKGNSRHSLMNTWKTMLYRCYNHKRNKHEFYADNNIKVCDRWHKFENFLQDMGEPKDGETLDRIDNTKGYCPENCRWSPQREQKLNRKSWGKSKYKGVRPHGEKFVATIIINKTVHYLGVFETEKEAALAYNKALIANGDDEKYCNIIEEDKK